MMEEKKYSPRAVAFKFYDLCVNFGQQEAVSNLIEGCETSGIKITKEEIYEILRNFSITIKP